MDPWGWLAGYVVLFALLHLLLYYFYVRRASDDTTSSPSFSEPDQGRPKSSPQTPYDHYPAQEEFDDPSELEETLEFDGETMQCPHCGARNESDQTFTYCWNCVSSIHR